MNTNQSPLQHVTGAVLAGGLSKRMGEPKHELMLPNQTTMLEKALSITRMVCQEVVVVAPEVVTDQAPHVHDAQAGRGPLAGIIELLASGLNDHYLVIPCDMPCLTPELLTQLCDPPPTHARVFQLESAKHAVPLPLAISSQLLSSLKGAQQQGIRSLHGALAQTQLDICNLSDRYQGNLKNINEPQDVQHINMTRVD